MSKRMGDGRERALWRRAASLASVLVLASRGLTADPVTVHDTEGLVHGFLSLRTLGGSPPADGDLLQVARGDRVTIRLVFHFKDGSLYTVRYADEHGQQKVASEHLDLPPDLANGLIPTLMKNVRSDAPPKTLSLVAATPKPRLVKVAIGSSKGPRRPSSNRNSHCMSVDHCGASSS